MNKNDMEQKLWAAHQRAIIYDGLKMGTLIGFVGLFIGYSSAVLAADSGGIGDPVAIKAIPMVFTAILLALVSYLAKLGEVTAEKTCAELKERLKSPAF
ncbi:MAG TPA: hypothetical protein VGK09_12595 [Rhodocyclaceae bacterium]|jgi:hypothetical protein